MIKLLSIFIIITLCTFCSVILSGCGMLNTESFIDFKRNENGEIILLDSSKNWEFWTLIADLHVANESTGKSAPGGASSWDEFWLSIIDEIIKHRENPQRYVNYIIDSRYKANLPDLRMCKSSKSYDTC